MAKNIFAGQTSRFQDLTNRKFGWITVLGFDHRRKFLTYWKCRCICGNQTIVCGSNLKSHSTTSCGCFQKKCAAIKHITHGLTKDKSRHPAYDSWEKMIYRCKSKTASTAKRYCLRGITVCERWKSLRLFLDDMLETWMPGLEIDRINNDGNYSCGKCDECRTKGWPMNSKWSTTQEQAINRSTTKWLTWRGETRYQGDWADLLGIKRQTLSDRMLKWSVDKSLSTPVNAHFKEELI